MAKALIVYSSRTGQTLRIGEIIAEGMRFSMVDVTIKKSREITKPEDLEGYDIYLFGSSTYHGEMIHNMKKVLFMAERAGLEGKAGGAFGSYGWSGEANERIFETMKNIFKMDTASSPLMLRDVEVQGGIKAAQEYGKELAAKIQ